MKAASLRSVRGGVMLRAVNRFLENWFKIASKIKYNCLEK